MLSFDQNCGRMGQTRKIELNERTIVELHFIMALYRIHITILEGVIPV